MKRIVKIGFPILCIAVIGGTFHLLNKTQDRVNEMNRENQNRTSNVTKSESLEDNINKVSNENVANSVNENNSNTVNSGNETNLPTTTTELVEDKESIEAKKIEYKETAKELVKKRDGERSQKVYYTNEGMDDDRYVVAVREEETTKAIIYYSVDVENENVKVYYNE